MTSKMAESRNGRAVCGQRWRRRRRRRSGPDQGMGPPKSMKVALGGVTKEVDRKKREVVMIMNVATGLQIIKMRFKRGEQAEKERLAAMNAHRQKADVW